ncbi:MAG: S9 family peptidase [Bacteroidales bacterium]|nr:S9 family peptidase [Bacteroidales bacterium]
MKRVLIALTLLTMAVSCNRNAADTGEGASAPQIENGVMTPEVLLSLGRVSDPQLSPDGSLILYGVNHQDLKKNGSRRNLFLCNADGSGRSQLTFGAGSVSNARWSPDGGSIWFLQDGQLWKAPLKGRRLGKKQKMSDVPAGIGEFKLSPDASQMIYISTVKGPVQTPADSDPALDKAKAYATEQLMYRHWDHWVTEIPHSFTAPLGDGPVTPANSTDILGADSPFELPTEPFGGTEQLDWHPDGRHIAYSCRKKTGRDYAFSTDTEIYIYDTQSGATVLIPMGGGYDTDPVWSPDGSRLAWLSMERDGYEADKTRLMVCDVHFNADGAASADNIRDLTEGFDHDASGPVWTGDDLCFNALYEKAVQGIFRVSADSGEVQRLTPEDWPCDFFSPFGFVEREDGLRLLTTYYSLHFPLELVAVDLKPQGASFTQLSHENADILGQLKEIRTELRQIPTTDGKLMPTWVVYPPEFDPAKVYPSILITLGGPQSSNSQDWSYRWCYRLMAQQGYIVVLPNRRGTTAFGQEWKEQISGDYPGQNMQDYLSAARALKAEPYVGKMAACGASYGGYSVYYLAGVHGDVFDCFIAHAGIFDEKYLWYTPEEMWFPNFDNGGVQDRPGVAGVEFGGIRQGGAPYSSLPAARRHYANSPESRATDWHTPILCIHGGMDFRIPYDQGMAAFNAAQLMGVPSKLVVFPDENHWILKPQNALYWHRTFFDWLDRWCK